MKRPGDESMGPIIADGLIVATSNAGLCDWAELTVAKRQAKMIARRIINLRRGTRYSRERVEARPEKPDAIYDPDFDPPDANRRIISDRRHPRCGESRNQAAR